MTHRAGDKPALFAARDLMTISRAEAYWAARTLRQQAKKNRDSVGNSSCLAPIFEAVASALEKGETIEIRRNDKAGKKGRTGK
jgi:hypothetical protein